MKRKGSIDLQGVYAMSETDLAALKRKCEWVVSESPDGNVVISTRLLLQLLAQAKPLTPSPGTPIEMLRLSNRAHDLLIKAGIKFIEGMARFEKEPLALHQINGMGLVTFDEVHTALGKYRKTVGAAL